MSKYIKQKYLIMEGDWVGTNRIWFEPNGKLNHECPTEEKIQFILDGRFLLHSTKTEINEIIFEGSRVLSYIENEKKYKSSWIDSFHNGVDIMIQEGTDLAILSVTGTYKGGDQLWGWRTEYKMISDNELIVAHYNIPPGGGEYRAVESTLTRVSTS
jgi:hypothetical protein